MQAACIDKWFGITEQQRTAGHEYCFLFLIDKVAEQHLVSEVRGKFLKGFHFQIENKGAE